MSCQNQIASFLIQNQNRLSEPEPDCELPDLESESDEPERELPEPEPDQLPEPDCELPDLESESDEPERELPEPEPDQLPEPDCELPDLESESDEPERELPDPERELPEPVLDSESAEFPNPDCDLSSGSGMQSATSYLLLSLYSVTPSASQTTAAENGVAPSKLAGRAINWFTASKESIAPHPTSIYSGEATPLSHEIVPILSLKDSFLPTNVVPGEQ